MAVAWPAGAADRLVPLVRALPWPGVTGLIGYGSKLWFVNSVKFVNHNSADVYSYDPASGKARYERRLFSQDAGDPAIANGLLYWPFEDSRFSPGRGEFMVTNGRDWRWGFLPEGTAFHVHAMAAHRGALYAALSAWRPHIQRSDDGGTNWKTLYEHDAPPRHISRITTAASFDGALYWGLTDWSDGGSAKLIRWTGKDAKPVEGWPRGSAVPLLVAYRGWLYARNLSENGAAIWRTDGAKVERLTALDRHAIRAMAAGRDALWAVSSHDEGGTLWRSADGLAWTRHQDFEGPKPYSVAAYAGHAYVGASGAAGGMLWGPAAPAAVEASAMAPAPPRGRPAPTEPLAASLARLDRVLAAPARYRELRTAIRPFGLRGDEATGRALAARLDGPFPAGETSMFGRSLTISSDKTARWYLLWAIARNGHARVPPGLISAPWTARPNRSEKYFEPTPAAAWAAAVLGQSDDATIAALVGRLGRAGDPPWLTGDIIGALTALTGQRFGYDIAAWRGWYEGRR